ncbi:MAG: adenylate/guanylate cyclase domain-containing protein [Kamptonema sp. SIO4C4]|nr:adenylate/guanylate cyclase domain-containing protein [Kamptonema sp. SIO4C4]
MAIALRKWFWGWRGVLIATPSITGLILLLRFAGLLQILELVMLDYWFQLRPREPIDERIVIVGITERDIQSLQRSIPTDAQLATVLQRIKAQNPHGIGLDLYRDLPENPGHGALQEVFRSTPNLTGIRKVVGNQGDRNIPAPPILAEQGQVGASDVPLDVDGKVRRGFLYIYAEAEDEYVPSLALRQAQFYLQSQGITPKAAPVDPRYLQLGEAVFFPLKENTGGYVRIAAGSYQLLINYRQASFQQVSFVEVLENRVAADLFTDRLVFISYTAQGKKDIHLTPYSTRLFGTAEQIPGVVIQAHLTSQIINAALGQRPLLQSWPEWVEWVWILFWSGVGASLSWQWRYSQGVNRWSWQSGVALILAGGSLLAACYLAFLGGWWLPLVPPFLGLFGSAIAITGYLAYQAADVRAIFGRYLADSVVANLLETPEGLNLGGKRQIVTILISDLRGFSAIAESLNPEETMHLLNLYFEKMTEVIGQYEGTINEFIGDGIIVFFGAPTQRPDDGERAIACAVAMQLAMEEVNEQLQTQYLPPLKMGIGIDTGEVVVGNVGSKKRAKWTVVGYHVNLAARIESFTAGHQILVSWDTLRTAKTEVQVEQQRMVQPKNRLYLPPMPRTS